MELRDQAEAAVHEIITEAVQKLDSGVEVDPATKRIAQLYSSFMNEAGNRRARRRSGWCFPEYYFGYPEQRAPARGKRLLPAQGHQRLHGYRRDERCRKPRAEPATFLQGGLGLPDESYYREEQFADTVADYQEHLARLLSLGGIADAQAAAEMVVELEKALASHHWDRVKVRDAQARYNLMSGEELIELFPGVKT